MTQFPPTPNRPLERLTLPEPTARRVRDGKPALLVIPDTDDPPRTGEAYAVQATIRVGYQVKVGQVSRVRLDDIGGQVAERAGYTDVPSFQKAWMDRYGPLKVEWCWRITLARLDRPRIPAVSPRTTGTRSDKLGFPLPPTNEESDEALGYTCSPHRALDAGEAVSAEEQKRFDAEARAKQQAADRDRLDRERKMFSSRLAQAASDPGRLARLLAEEANEDDLRVLTRRVAGRKARRAA